MPGDSLTGSGGLCTNPSFLQVGEARHALQALLDIVSTTFFEQELRRRLPNRPSLRIEAFDAAHFCFIDCLTTERRKSRLFALRSGDVQEEEMNHS